MATMSTKIPASIVSITSSNTVSSWQVKKKEIQSLTYRTSKPDTNRVDQRNHNCITRRAEQVLHKVL